MAGEKFIRQVSGVLTEITATQTSTGVTEANKIVALDATGHLDNSVMPVGIGTETDSIVTSEALSAGDFVNVWSSTGAKARKADASTTGKAATGFVLAGYAPGATAIVYRPTQVNTALTGMTPGAKQYLNPSIAGGITETIPTTAGQTLQILGIAKSATELIFNLFEPITLA